jgi:hypothetical protein
MGSVRPWPTQSPIQKLSDALPRDVSGRLVKLTSPPFIAGIKNEWSRTSIFPYDFTASKGMPLILFQLSMGRGKS